MPFICDHDGAVIQKNLGAVAHEVAAWVTCFDPDANWLQAKQRKTAKWNKSPSAQGQASISVQL
jgi:hypothetical protein